MSKFKIDTVYYLARKSTIAEIWYNSCLWAEISTKSKGSVLKFYNHPDQEYWELPCEEAILILQQAKEKLRAKSSHPKWLEKTHLPDPKSVNEEARKLLESILNHPEKKLIPGEFSRFGKVVDIYAPEIGGARYNASGEFIGFLEP